MSELRDLIAAHRAQSARLTAIEECLTELVRNTNPQNLDIRLKQMEEFQGALWKYLGKLDERLGTLSQEQHDGTKALSARVSVFEDPEEVTKP